jgi:hypothetical protein
MVVRVAVPVAVAEHRLGPRFGGAGVEHPAGEHGGGADRDPERAMAVMRMRPAVIGVVVVDVLAARMGMHAETGLADQCDDGVGLQPRRIVRDVHTPADEVEVQVENAGYRQDVAHQRRLVGTVHAADVQPQFGACRGRRS